MSFVNEIYTDITEVAVKYRLPLDEKPTEGFAHERDWRFRLVGRGLRGGRWGSWLVTFAARRSPRAGRIVDDPAPATEGYLVAHANDGNGNKTGEVLVLAGPWSYRTDEIMLEEAGSAGVLGTVDKLVAWLASRA